MERIFTTRVLHDGWETDNEVWVEEDESGKRVLKTTNHGDEEDMGLDELKEKIEETESSLHGLREALKLVEAEFV